MWDERFRWVLSFHLACLLLELACLWVKWDACGKLKLTLEDHRINAVKKATVWHVML